MHILQFLVLDRDIWHDCSSLGTLTTVKESFPHFDHFSTFGSDFAQIPNVEFSKFQKNMNFFAQNEVLLYQKVNVVQRSCLQVKEQVLRFSEHQKSLKSIDYS